MNSKVINGFMFAAGAAIGSAVTWLVIRNKYEQIVQEEIESIKEAFCGSERDVAQEVTEDSDDDESDVPPEGVGRQINWAELEDLDEDDEESDEDGLNDYERVVNKYTNKKGGAEEMVVAPYVIGPYDFGELDDWNQVELTYYEGDDTLEDDEGNIVTDRDELLGPKALFTFGEYEDDAVFVRNERLRTDFQILKDYRRYADARSIGPGRVGDE